MDQRVVNLPQQVPLSPARQLLGLVVSVIVCLGVAGLGSAATVPQIPGWYAQLEKPPWNPPDWVFAPVWTTLFLMMALAAWLVWRQGGFRAARLPLALFGVQLALNCLWSVLFFGLQSPGAAALEIVVLWAAIAATLVSFWNKSRLAGSLLVPYLAWVSFAAMLNVAIWRLNA